MSPVLYVALGGSLGASARYLLGHGAQKLWPASAFPWGTFLANVIGGLVMGLFIGWMSAKLTGSENMRLFMAVGVLGGFTTFSSFSLEALRMIETKSYALAAGYIGGSVILSVAAVFFGLVIARKLFAV